MSKENKNLTPVSEDSKKAEKEAKKAEKQAKKAEKNKNKKGGLKAFLKSRTARHGTVAAGIVVVFVAILIVINIICGLLVDRFPNVKLDLTANNSFALQDDTVDYMSHLTDDITINILSTKETFESGGTYYIQAENLLDKMVSASNGKITLKYIDLTSNPNFISKYPDVSWQSENANYVALVECGDNYRALSLDDCFDYELDSYGYSYQFTGTKIEQAVVTAILNLTTEDKPIVNVISGNQEQDYSSFVTLLENNAFDVEEISLVSQDLNEDAKVALLFAPSVDLDEGACDKISDWLDNNGKYGRTLVFIPSADRVDTPNLDALLDEWGMQVNGGYVFETNSDYLISSSTNYAFMVEYADYYKDNLKNSNIPVVTSDTHNIIINDENTAHALLTTSDGVGVFPYDADEDWNYEDALTGEPLNVAAEGVKTNSDDESSRLIVFGSYMMFNSSIMSMNSYNNSAYIMNVFNTVAGKDDSSITIESKSLESAELGVTDVTTQNAVFVIFIVVIPLGILVVGLVMWLRRRNR